MLRGLIGEVELLVQPRIQGAFLKEVVRSSTYHIGLKKTQPNKV